MRPPTLISHSTVADVFKAGRRRCLDLDLVVAIVRALGVDEAEVARRHQACVKVHGLAVEDRRSRRRVRSASRGARDLHRP